ncbi:sterol C4-methyl oxidase 1-2 [Actinidia rufa]|uniref:Sterol C4-methyl oxidase 1-2 n=1 Tax=Actinidia rufa TaxID=165716 RepID=A0A7J0FRK6_9ERIC|nr:sterol C4-methyl oxidase 1-2 [Actinidia rufa]
MLPYTTAKEAEAFLGRPLTALETLWLNYSATKSDYYLYCHNILFLFVVFSVVPVFYLLLELACSKTHRYKIQPKIKLSLSQSFRCYRDVMRMFFLVVGPLQLVSYPSIKVLRKPICICIAIEMGLF